MRGIIASVLVAALVLTGCGIRKPDKEEVTFLTLRGPSSVGMIYLIDSPGILRNHPLSIEVLDEPMMVRARMLADKPEMAVLPLNMAAILYNSGIGYRVAAIPVWGSLYVFGTDSLTGGWESFRNRQVYVMGRGSTPDILFRYLLEHHGINPERDLNLDYSFPTHIDLANAVIAGLAGLAVLSEPMVSLAEAKNPRIRLLLDLNREWADAFPDRPSLPQTAFLVREDYLAAYPGEVRAVCEAWNRSVNRVNLRPDLAAGLIVRNAILPDSSVAFNAISRCNLKFRYAADVRGEISRYLGVFANFNPDAIGGAIPDEAFIAEKPAR